MCRAETQPCASEVLQKDLKDFGIRRKMLVAMYVQPDRGKR